MQGAGEEIWGMPKRIFSFCEVFPKSLIQLSGKKTATFWSHPSKKLPQDLCADSKQL